MKSAVSAIAHVYGASPKKLADKQASPKKTVQSSLIEQQTQAEGSVDEKIEKLQNLLKLAKMSK